MNIALDTMILIYGLKAAHGPKRRSSPVQKSDLERRAWILLQDLSKKTNTLIVPTIVVAELLVGIDKVEHGNFVAELQRRFFCPPFDVRAAALAAELWNAHKSLPSGQQTDRRSLKVDVLIIASAKVAGAEAFYSSDPSCRALASKAQLQARDLPTHSENLFTERESYGEHNE